MLQYNCLRDAREIMTGFTAALTLYQKGTWEYAVHKLLPDVFSALLGWISHELQILFSAFFILVSHFLQTVRLY